MYKVSDSFAEEVGELNTEGKKLDKATQYVPALAFSCAIQGLRKPGERVVKEYVQYVSPIQSIVCRIDAFLESLDLDDLSSTISRRIEKLQVMVFDLLFRADIICSWIDDDDRDDDESDDFPPLPSGTSNRPCAYLAI